MAAQPLSAVAVIVTRPETQAAPWARQLQQLGATTQLLPVLEIVPVTEPQARQAIKNCIVDFDQFQKVIFVSQNAVLEAARWLDQYWPQLPVGIDYFAVGSTTAQVASAQGLSVQAAAQAMNSETLLALPALQQVSGQKILIFRGVGGRGLMAQTLRERGAQVGFCELYERHCPTAAVFQWRDLALAPAPRQTVLSVHSGESLENLTQLLRTSGRDECYHLPLLVPGERVATLAQQQGFTSIVVAANATDQAMTQALIDWRERNEQ